MALALRLLQYGQKDSSRAESLGARLMSDSSVSRFHGSPGCGVALGSGHKFHAMLSLGSASSPVGR